MHVLDTDITVGYMKGDEKICALVQSLAGLHTTVATLAELSYGLHNSQNPQKHARNLLDFLQGVSILGIGLPTSFKFGELKAHMRSAGKPVGDFDLLIASSCIVHGYRLVTGNRKHFEGIPGLKILEP